MGSTLVETLADKLRRIKEFLLMTWDELEEASTPPLEYLRELHGTKMAMYWAFTASMQVVIFGPPTPL